MKRFLLILLIIGLLFSVGCNAYETNSLDFAKIINNQEEYIDQESWKLPKFTGWSCVEVAHVLDNIGQKYEIIFIDDEDANVNVVTEQYPAGGEKVQKDEVLKLEVNNYYASSNAITAFKSFINPIAEMGGWVYFTDGRSLYKSCNDFDKCEKIYSLDNSNGRIVTIIPRENEIFFIMDYRKFDYRLCSVKIGCENHREIYEPRVLMGCHALGDTIYLLDGDMNIISYDIKQNEIDIVASEFRTYSYLQHSGHRYYMLTGESKFKLCDQNVENQSITVLTELGNNLATDICFFKNDLYYICYSKNNNDDFFYIDEWLYKYDLNTKKNTLIKKVGANQGAADQNQLFYWRGSMVVANEDRIIKINIEDDSYEEIKILRPEGDMYSHSILCGNYIYQYIPYGETNKLCKGRYNLLTEEYEEFDWDEVIPY